VSVNGTLVEAKMWTFTLESMHFLFSKCHIYTHDGASALFSNDSHGTDYSAAKLVVVYARTGRADIHDILFLYLLYPFLLCACKSNVQLVSGFIVILVNIS